MRAKVEPLKKKAKASKSLGGRREAALAAWRTRKSPVYRARRTEQASKTALSIWAAKNGWQVIFFESSKGAPRTGIVDALLVRIAPRDADRLELRLVQLKAGSSGLKATEVRRLKASVESLGVSWYFVAFDGKELHWSTEADP